MSNETEERDPLNLRSFVTRAEYERRAIAAYYRAGIGNSLHPIPSRNGTTIEQANNGRHYVVVCNVNGVLAVYRITNGGKLKGLKRWPKELESF